MLDFLILNSSVISWQIVKSGSYNVWWREILRTGENSHISLVIVTDLLDADIVLCINERLRCGIGLGQGHDTSDILKVILIVYFNLG